MCLTFSVRYLRKCCVPVERFFKFLLITSDSSLDLYNVIVETLCDEFQIKDQTYDNVDNMSRIYFGVQARILQKNEKAVKIPCIAHSLNLTGGAFVQSYVDAISFFRCIQKLYAFSSLSTSRWRLLKDKVVENRVSRIMQMQLKASIFIKTFI